MRRRIWSKLLPAKMPLGPDVNIEQLIEAELSGGEIKNVIVNAARLALARGDRCAVTMTDLRRSLERETRWGVGATRHLGFAARRRDC